MSAYRHRKTADPLARLSEQDRAELRLEGLSREVNEACTAWLLARGLCTPPATSPATDSQSPAQEGHTPGGMGLKV